MAISPLVILAVLLAHGTSAELGRKGAVLLGEGSHRTLVYPPALLSSLVHAADERCGVGRTIRGEGAMRPLTLLQRLPIELFVDPHELQSIQRSKLSSGWKVEFILEPSSSIDIELPSFAINESMAVLIRIKISTHGDPQAGIGGLTLPPPHSWATPPLLKVHLPLHARYPPPQHCSHTSNRSSIGWSRLMSSHVRVVIQPPSLLIDCNGSGEKSQVALENGSRDDDDEQGELEWMIPAGCLEHQELVAWGILVSSIAAGSSIAWYARR